MLFWNFEMNWKNFMIILIVAVVIILVWFLVVSFINKSEIFEEVRFKKACKELGCPSGSQFVGSVNSDKFYPCDCHYALRVKPENRVCFEIAEDAVNEGRIRSAC